MTEESWQYFTWHQQLCAGAYGRPLELKSQNLLLSGQALDLAGNSPNPLHLPDALFLTGLLLLDRGDPNMAKPFLSEAFTLQQSLPLSAWTIGRSEWALGECLLRLGQLEEAQPLLLESQRVLQATIGLESVWTRATRQSLVDIYDARALSGGEITHPFAQAE